MWEEFYIVDDVDARSDIKGVDNCLVVRIEDEIIQICLDGFKFDQKF